MGEHVHTFYVTDPPSLVELLAKLSSMVQLALMQGWEEEKERERRREGRCR